jgi:hypothetical protein
MIQIQVQYAGPDEVNGLLFVIRDENPPYLQPDGIWRGMMDHRSDGWYGYHKDKKSIIKAIKLSKRKS